MSPGARPSRRCGMSVDEFSGLVAVVLTDRHDPDNSYVPDTAETVHKRRSSAAPCPEPSSPRSFLPPIPRSASLFDTLAFLGLKLPPNPHSSPATPVHGSLVDSPNQRQNSLSPSSRHSRTASNASASTPRPVMTSAFDPPYASTLVMGTSSPSGGRKPLALLSKFKRQLSKASSSAPNSPARPEHGARETVRHTVNGVPDRPAAPTVSFAPTPVPSPSVSTFTVPTSRPSTSSSGVFSRTSTSDADSSFLDCEEKRSFRASSSKLRNTIFRNRNAHLNSRSQQDLFPAHDDADIRSLATMDSTAETATDEAATTESGDYIPYIPLVLRREKDRLRTESQTSAAPPVIASRRTTMKTIARSTPSPTPSNSTIGSGSTRSPRTPRTPVFGHHVESSPSVSLDSDEERDETQDALSFTSTLDSAELGHEKAAYTSPQSKTKTSLGDIDNGNLEDPFGTGRFDSIRRPHQTSTAHATQGHDDVFTQPHPFVTQLEDDQRTVASTSESCYSTESFNDPADALYRRSRMDSSVLPPDDIDFLPSAGGFFSALRAGGPDIGSPASSPPPPAIRIETASVISEPQPPTPTANGYHGIGHPLDHRLRLHDGDDLVGPSPSYQPPLVPKLGVGRQTIDPRTLKQESDSPSPSRGRKLSSKAKGGKAEASSASKEFQEWTLHLGTKETEEFEEELGSAKRSRTASQGRAGKKAKEAKEKEDKARPRTKSAGPMVMLEEKPVERKKSEKKLGNAGLSVPPLDGDADILGTVTLPFANDLHVQKPLLRIQSIADMGLETDDDHADEEDARLSRKDRNKALRRSGSAHPVLDGGAKQARKMAEQQQDQVDWTLMLPLPFPTKTKNVPLTIRTDVSKANGAKSPPKVIHKARSSVDLLSTPVIHMRTRKPSSAKKDRGRSRKESAVKARARTPSPPPQQEKELSAEAMLAAIFGQSDDEEGAVGTSGGKSNEGKGMDRNEHRQKALDVLSGNSSPSSTEASGPPESSLPSSPLPLLPSTEVKGQMTSPGSPSSSLAFEKSLCALVDETDDEPTGTCDEHLIESARPSDDTMETSTTLCNASPVSHLPSPPPSSTIRQSLKPISAKAVGAHAISPMLPPSPPPSASVILAAANLGRPTQSLSSRAPIGVSRDKGPFGLSFSQYATAKLPPTPLAARVSLDTLPPRPASGTVLPFAVSRSAFAPVSNERPRTAPQGTTGSPLGSGLKKVASPPQLAPVVTASKPEEKGEDTEKSSLPPPHKHSRTISVWSVESFASTSTTSSVDTVVPDGGKNRSSEDLSSPASDCVGSPISGHQEPRPKFQLEDFPLPPASLPLSGVVPSGSVGSDAMSTALSSLTFLQRPSSGERVPLTPVLGADEDAELPPPTPVSATASSSSSPLGSPQRRSPQRSPPASTMVGSGSPPPKSELFSTAPGSPSNRLPALRASPTPRSDMHIAHSMSIFGHGTRSQDEADHAGSSGWMDDDDDDDDEDEYGAMGQAYGVGKGRSFYGSDEGGETEYEDAVSMFAVSDEDYEDAVSMLSGVFYSARNSFDD